MDEKVYRLMSKGGGLNIALGIVLICIGTATGVLLIINGAKLISGKHKLMF